MTPKQIAERILELDGKATKGKWTHDPQAQRKSKYWESRKHYYQIGLKGSGIAQIGKTWNNKYDAQLITYYRNHAPILARAWESQQKKLDEAAIALRKVCFEIGHKCDSDCHRAVDIAQQALNKIKEIK